MILQFLLENLIIEKWIVYNFNFNRKYTKSNLLKLHAIKILFTLLKIIYSSWIWFL